MNKNYIQMLYVVQLIVFLMLIPCTIQAQQKKLWKEKQAYNWCFGAYGGLSFETGSPVPFQGSQSTGLEGTTAISSPEGELLFYAASLTIWDRSHNVMQNGASLEGLGTSQSQAGVVIPKPGSETIYYLFATSDKENFRLTYNVIDMSLNDGFGAVIQRDVSLNVTSSEKITSVYHANGKDIWVIAHEIDNNNFVAHLVTENGVSSTPITSSIGFEYPKWSNYVLGQLKASPDGKHLASAVCGLFMGEERGVEVFDFNNETGEITNRVFYTASETAGMVYGVEFSPNSQYVYMTETTYMGFLFIDGKLQQFDLHAGDAAAIQSSRTPIVDLSGSLYTLGSLQLAPDGKIYMPNGMLFNENVHAINFPNNKGTAAGFQPAAVLLGVVTYLGIPNFTSTYFESGIESEGNCPNQDVTFTTVRIPGITSISWDFGDSASGAANISNQPVHAFSGPGTYTVTAYITSNGAVQVATTEVVVIEGPKAVSPAAEFLTQCADENGNAVFNLSSFSTTIIDGQDTDIFSLAYFTTDADRLANNPITDLENFTTAGQTIYTVVTSSETGCTTVLPLTLVVNPLPVVTTPANIEQCGNLEGISVFNLKNQDTAILNGQNPEGFTIAYYSDEAMTSAISQPESFTTAGQTISAEVTNTTTGCSSSVSFDTVVTEVDLISGELIVEGCSPFNLITILPQIPAGITVNFYPTEGDALNSTNVIADTENYMPAANADKVYVVATNAEGCQSISEVQLKYMGCIIPRGISPNGDDKNDRFDLSSFDVKTLKVFNRYGKEVYKKDNYKNQFFGQGTHGDDLPSGTYYYVIQLRSGEEKTGWVYISTKEN
ncbi:PKD domain protein [compost metagenome]